MEKEQVRSRAWKLVRSERRTIAIEIGPGAETIVRAPRRAPMEMIQKFIHEKQNWILRQQDRVRQRAEGLPAREYQSGERFFYLGRWYPLRLAAEGNEPLTFDGEFRLVEARRHQGRALFEKWYGARAKAQIPGRVLVWAERMGLTYRTVRISRARRRWGSCSLKGNLRFSWQLMMTPWFVIDGVIIHELAHLRIANHSKAFWQLVHRFCPDYASVRAWLRAHEALLIL
ncbi:M48 family metallopeptidase [Omnitrophica bacterium]|nr:M48 family metallopeptidase [Candidatus Omnitrophota bacterium]